MSASMPLPSAFSFAYDATTRRLVGHWQALVDEPALRRHYTDLLAAACAHDSCNFWQLDLRGRNWHTSSFEAWFTEVFAKAVRTDLHQPLFIAYILNPEHHALVSTPGVQATLRGCVAHGVYPFFFDSEAPAREWLAHQQAHDIRS